MNNLADTRQWLVSTVCQAAVITTATVVLNMGSATVAKGTQPHLTLTVRVYNYAGVDPKTLMQAEKVTEAIFRKVGVEMRWVSSPLNSATKHENSSERIWFHSSDVQINILPGSMSESFGWSRDLGFALGVGPNPEVAYVFYERAERLARQQMAEKRLHETSTGIVERRADIGQLLGHVIAHELGHLLGLRSHARTGIMRADWNLTDFQDIAFGYFSFTPQQADVIRAEVRRRTAKKNKGSMRLDASDQLKGISCH
jgi:predicted Zn-dependent protease